MRLFSFLTALCLLFPTWAYTSPVSVGDIAPEVELRQLPSNREILSLHSLRGKVVYLDFWASWCGPCRLSFPQLDAIRNELGAEGFEVYAINVDEFEDDALRFLAERPVSYPVVRDATGNTPADWGVPGMPTGFLIDRKGVIRHIHIGFRKSDGAKLRAVVINLMRE